MATETTPSTAMAVSTPKKNGNNRMAYHPRSLTELRRVCEYLINSDLMPKSVKSPQDLFAIALAGHDLGLTLSQSLMQIHVIEGKPSLAADLMVALCERQRDICEYFYATEITAEKATYVTKRRNHPEPETVTVTMEDMSKVKFKKWEGPQNNRRQVESFLVHKDTWQNYPADMLGHRAASRLGRRVYPDILGGFYTPDEIEGLRDAEDAVYEDISDGMTTEEIQAKVEALRAERNEQATETKEADVEILTETVREPEIQETIELKQNGTPAPRKVIDMARMTELRRLMLLCATAADEGTETYRPTFLHGQYGVENYGDLSAEQIEDAIGKLTRQSKKVQS